jgi:hypothetical protein
VKPILERDKSIDKPLVSFLNPNAERPSNLGERRDPNL